MFIEFYDCQQQIIFIEIYHRNRKTLYLSEKFTQYVSLPSFVAKQRNFFL